MNNVRSLENEALLRVNPAKVTVQSFCTPEMVERLSFNRAFEAYPGYRPIITKKETLVRIASDQDANVALAFTNDKEVVGLGILQPPSPDDRWTRVGPGVMMEIALIEVARPWRGLGISRKILDLLMIHPLKDKRIIFVVGYSWTWDLGGKGMTPEAYRNMLIKIGAEHGFEIFQTNEPNILLKPENVFMARIGAYVSEETKKRFKWVRFNLDLSLQEQWA